MEEIRGLARPQGRRISALKRIIGHLVSDLVLSQVQGGQSAAAVRQSRRNSGGSFIFQAVMTLQRIRRQNRRRWNDGGESTKSMWLSSGTAPERNRCASARAPLRTRTSVLTKASLGPIEKLLYLARMKLSRRSSPDRAQTPPLGA